MTTLVSAPVQGTSSNRFTHLLATRPWLLADGATGSNLFDVGLMSGDAPELWNTEHPERITKLHQDFVDAGADIILTNSFGGTVYRLKLHNAQGRMAELNTCAAQIARKVADASGRTVAVAGSMGPTGEIMEPIGPLTFDQAKAAFAEQALEAKTVGDDGALFQFHGVPSPTGLCQKRLPEGISRTGVAVKTSTGRKRAERVRGANRGASGLMGRSRSRREKARRRTPTRTGL